MTLGEKLQLLRKQNNMSQEELASKITVSRQSVSKWELGDSTPDIDNIAQLSKLFSVSTDYLIIDENEDACIKEKQTKNNDKNTPFLLILMGGVALMAIGLLCGIADYSSEQNIDNIFGSMIIQIVGIAAYVTARIIYKSHAPFIVDFLSVAICIFMPISLFVTLFFKVGKLSPFPTSSDALILFLGIYAMIMIIFSILVIRKNKKSST